MHSQPKSMHDWRKNTFSKWAVLSFRCSCFFFLFLRRFTLRTTSPHVHVLGNLWTYLHETGWGWCCIDDSVEPVLVRVQDCSPSSVRPFRRGASPVEDCRSAPSRSVWPPESAQSSARRCSEGREWGGGARRIFLGTHTAGHLCSLPGWPGSGTGSLWYVEDRTALWHLPKKSAWTVARECFGPERG